ncbi:MAG: hypothetical protein Q4G13_02715 [Moraxella sp.]|nr:hypothetical protein [Moraxella sp.]
MSKLSVSQRLKKTTKPAVQFEIVQQWSHGHHAVIFEIYNKLEAAIATEDKALSQKLLYELRDKLVQQAKAIPSIASIITNCPKSEPSNDTAQEIN